MSSLTKSQTDSWEVPAKETELILRQKIKTHLANLSREKTVRTWIELLKGAKATGRPGAFYRMWRVLCLEDLAFLLIYCCNRVKLNHDWLFARVREVEADPDEHLDIWAREHFKSTIITFGLTLQDILDDPEETVGIFSHSRPIAKGFLRQHKWEMEANINLKAAFPDVLYQNPKREAPKWSEDEGLVIKRVNTPKEATISAWGLVDSQPTSAHFTIMIFDDVVTEDSVTTPEMIKKTTTQWELALNLESGILAEKPARLRYIGTRYHYNDTYKTMMDRKAAVPRIYPATDNGKVDGNPVLLTREALAKKRRLQGPYTFACQQLLDPKADDTQGFMKQWLRYWKADHYTNLVIAIICDPANEKKTDSDYSCFTVLGLGADGNWYVITWVRDRLNLFERGNVLFALHRQYKPQKVYYEKYGKDSDIQHYEYKMERLNYRFTIHPLGGKVKKEDRIKGLVPDFEQGLIYIPETCVRVNYEGVQEDLVKVFINDEYLAFPFSTYDDMLDCLARKNDPVFKLQKPSYTPAPTVRRDPKGWT